MPCTENALSYFWFCFCLDCSMVLACYLQDNNNRMQLNTSFNTDMLFHGGGILKVSLQSKHTYCITCTFGKIYILFFPFDTIAFISIHVHSCSLIFLLFIDFLFKLFHLREASCISVNFLLFLLFFLHFYWRISFMFVHVVQSELTYLIYWVSLLFIGFSFWMIFKTDWLTDSLTEWLTDGLTDWLTGWLTGRLNHSLSHSFIDFQWF